MGEWEKWGNERMGEWENERMGEWGNGLRPAKQLPCLITLKLRNREKSVESALYHNLNTLTGSGNQPKSRLNLLGTHFHIAQTVAKVIFGLVIHAFAIIFNVEIKVFLFVFEINIHFIGA